MTFLTRSLPLFVAAGLAACTSAPERASESFPRPEADPSVADLEQALGADELPPELLRLQPFVGSWDVAIDGLLVPGGALERLGSGKAEIDWRLGGRFLRWALTFELDGTPHESVGFLSWDAEARAYQSFWLSDLSGDMTLLRGLGGPLGSGLVLRGEARGASGMRRMRVEKAGGLLVEGFAKDGEGRDVLVRRTRYRRVDP
ncbi:MAG: DUF1579 domain-containing protein [bacterium]|nr:DUF1579 domain-containing protein [bacterium]